jgi:hypothetical protein
MLDKLDESNTDLLVSRPISSEGTGDAIDELSNGMSVTKVMEPSGNVTTSASSINCRSDGNMSLISLVLMCVELLPKSESNV